MKPKIKRAFLDTEDGQIFYQTAGEGDPLLLLHMTPRSSDEFRELIPLVAEHRFTIAMDLMGVGNSDPPPRVYSIADYAQTAIALLDELGIHTCSIFGSMTGGYIAGELAATNPDRVQKLILCNLPRFDAEDQERLLRYDSRGFQIAEDGQHLMQRWRSRVNYLGTGELNHRCVLDDLKCFGRPLYPGVAVANYCLSAPERFQLIQCPTLILSGTRALEPLEKFGLAKPKNQAWLESVIPHSQEIDISGGTMWMVNQMAEEIAQVVIDFLERQQVTDVN